MNARVKPSKPVPTLWSRLAAEAAAAQLLADRAFDGVRDQRHFDEMESEARAIGRRLLEAFRGAR